MYIVHLDRSVCRPNLRPSSIHIQPLMMTHHGRALRPRRSFEIVVVLDAGADVLFADEEGVLQRLELNISFNTTLASLHEGCEDRMIRLLTQGNAT